MPFVRMNKDLPDVPKGTLGKIEKEIGSSGKGQGFLIVRFTNGKTKTLAWVDLDLVSGTLSNGEIAQIRSDREAEQPTTSSRKNERRGFLKEWITGLKRIFSRD